MGISKKGNYILGSRKQKEQNYWKAQSSTDKRQSKKRKCLKKEIKKKMK